MASIAILFGILLNILGVGFYLYTGATHPTALIPCIFGVLFLLLGFMALRDNLRMHAMHGAALIGLLGVGVPAFQVVRKLAGGGAVDNAVIEQIAMAVLCGFFVVLCVRSFIAVRRRRKQAEQTS